MALRLPTMGRSRPEHNNTWTADARYPTDLRERRLDADKNKGRPDLGIL